MRIASAHVHLEIDVDSDPISGLIHGADFEPRRFDGWMELAAAIEEARGERRIGPNSGVGAWGEPPSP